MKKISVIAAVVFLFIESIAPIQAVASGLSWHGFLETDLGYKVKNNATAVQETKDDTFNLKEMRVQVKTHYYPESFLSEWSPGFFFRGDFLVDNYFTSRTAFELKEFYSQLTVTSFMDLKIGRQIFTWGTGDLLFINDVFPKDYVSFISGRNDEYLKAPSDGIRASLFSDVANLDIVLIPLFSPNIIANGDRLSFFDSFSGGIAGTASEWHLKEPRGDWSNMEIATRLYHSFDSYEVALYGFHGFYKMPRGYQNEAKHDLFYPKLNVAGASVRGPFMGGIANAEVGAFQSVEDKGGSNRLIQNSSIKAMVGYEKDFKNDLRIGIQYKYEQLKDYDAYLKALKPWDYYWDEFQHTYTLRITKFFMRQTLYYSLFTFYSPSDKDCYLRPVITYNITDSLTATLGANLIWGKQVITDWGQFERNANIYIRIRQSF